MARVRLCAAYYSLLTISFTRESNAQLVWADIASYLPYIGHASLNNTIGVQNGTIYDVVDNNNGTAPVAVSAVSFKVSCGSIPNVTVAGIPPNQTTSWSITANNDNGVSISTTSGMIGKGVSCSQLKYINIMVAAPYVIRSLGYDPFSVVYHNPVSSDKFWILNIA